MSSAVRKAARFSRGRVVRSYIIQMGGQLNTDQLMETAREQGFQVNDYIEQETFPIEPGPESLVRIVSYDPECEAYSFEEGRQFLLAAGIGIPTYEHGLRCLVQHGMSMKAEDRRLTFLHDPWWSGRTFRFLYLSHLFGRLEIALDCVRGEGATEDQVFGPQHLLAGVLPIEG